MRFRSYMLCKRQIELGSCRAFGSTALSDVKYRSLSAMRREIEVLTRTRHHFALCVW